MPIGEQTDGEAFNQIVLADHDFADLVEQGAHEGAGFLNFFVNRSDSSIHVHTKYNKGTAEKSRNCSTADNLPNADAGPGWNAELLQEAQTVSHHSCSCGS